MSESDSFVPTQSAKPTHYFFGDDIVFAVEPGVDIIMNIFTSRYITYNIFSEC